MKHRLLPALLLAAVVPAAAQHGHATLSNPYTSPDDVAAGGRIYRSHCAVCHGLQGKGDRGTDLTNGMFRHGANDDDIYKTVSEGIPGTEMPGTFFNGRQLWQIVAYVRSLSAGRAAEQTKGDPIKGLAVYNAKGCGGCHLVNGEGGRMGPDLSRIGERRSLGHLQMSVTKPNENVLPQNWSVRAVTRDGKKINGRRMNEDTFSVQLLDANERLVSLSKADLAQFEIDRNSSMPAYEGQFQGGEFDDLIAYLASLRGPEANQAAE